MDDIDKTIAPQRFGGRREGNRFSSGESILGRYKVLAELGQGGMGVVYKCFDETAGIEVALKALPPELSHNSLEMEDIRHNFQLVEKLHHPNIAAYKNLERDSATGDYYLIMECVEGQELSRWFRAKRREGALSPAEVLPIVRQIASALDYAHGLQIIHRDIKPGNIMIAADGAIKVLDFGLAAQIHTSMTRVSMAYHGTSGTGPYMAPEQWEGQAQDAAADQYALAVLAYELLAGHPPFESHDIAILREAVLKGTPRQIERIPASAWNAVKRAMSKDRALRFATCSDFAAALGGAKVGGGGAGGFAWKRYAGIGIAASLLVITLVSYNQYQGNQKKIEAEHMASRKQEQPAKPESDCQVQTESEKKIQDEAERKAQEKKIQDEAERRACEKKIQDEAERKAQAKRVLENVLLAEREETPAKVPGIAYDKSVTYGKKGIVVNTSSKLRDALENAKEGDSINVADGIYSGRFKVTKNIMLTGESASGTILNGEIWIESTTVKIRNCAIENNSDTAINMKAGSNVFLLNCHISGKDSLYSWGGELQIINSDIEGDLFIRDLKSGGINKCRILSSRYTGRYEGIRTRDTDIHIENCYITSKHTGNSFVSCSSDNSANCKFISCTFDGNVDGSKGWSGIDFFGNGYLSLEYCKFSNFQKYAIGTSGNVMLKNCTFSYISEFAIQTDGLSNKSTGFVKCANCEFKEMGKGQFQNRSRVKILE